MPPSRYWSLVLRVFPRLMLATFLATSVHAQESEAEKALRTGDYAKAAELADPAAGPREAETHLRALLATGHYAEAQDSAVDIVARFPDDAPALVAAHDALKAVGRETAAENTLVMAARTFPGNYDPPDETPANAAARARALNILGADPKLVLDRILQQAVSKSPEAREPYLALADIALEKHDYALAARTLRNAARRFPNDAEIEFGLAQSFADPKSALPHLEAALKANPRLVPALLFETDRLIDVENFEDAKKILGDALAVNPKSPDALARRSLLAQLQADPGTAKSARAEALALRPKNPEVDYAIGVGLARQYRFREAIESLQSAVKLDPSHLPSHFELGSNLLRYGNEKDGWDHVKFVQERDPYHVAAFNLMTLSDTMASMKPVTESGVSVRLAEADRVVFGQQAARLSAEARDAFSRKYQVDIPFDVTVDVLPTEQDFAVRTFNLPGNEGFLGVCFGPLITTCSPRGRLERANWQAILWHEMAHVITLTGTNHRIPRWLSEGISVHEENLHSSGWGMGMNSRYRDAILNDKDLPPLRDLDAGFRGEDIELAYFRAGLAAEFIEQRVGVEGVRRILTGLRDDQTPDTALEAVVGPLDKFEKDFDDYCRGKAKAYGAGIDWTPLTEGNETALRADPAGFLSAYPNRYFAIMARAHDLAREQSWAAVVALLEPLVKLEPNNREQDNPYALLAAAQKGLNNTAAEKAALEKQLSLDAAALPAARRLLEIAAAEKDPKQVAHAATDVLAIDPYNSDALLALGRNLLKAGDFADATHAYEALLSGKPLNAPRLRLELARSLIATNRAAARRQVLLALEENPPLTPALDLLLRLHDGPAANP